MELRELLFEPVALLPLDLKPDIRHRTNTEHPLDTWRPTGQLCRCAPELDSSVTCCFFLPLRLFAPAPLWSPAPPAVDLMALVGSTVKRSFDGVWYDAKVSFVKPYFRLTFTDGDELDLGSADFKSLSEGVFEGARLRYHCGEPWRWRDVVVQERYEGKRTHGPIWEADQQPFNSTARDSWVVEFTQDGEFAPIDLRITRKVPDTTGSVPGTWMPLS